jgi:hypothetical protein
MGNQRELETLAAKKSFYSWVGLGVQEGFLQESAASLEFSQLPVIHQVELLAYEYQNQNIENSTLYSRLQIIVTGIISIELPF